MILKFIIFFFLFIYIIGQVLKGIFRFFVGKLTDNLNQNNFQQQQQQQQNNARKREGEVTIDFIDEKNKKKGKKDIEGDYVDYVEVKD